MEIRAENYSRARSLDIGVEHALLLQIVRHGVLRQKRRLQPDFGANPFALGVRSSGGWLQRPPLPNCGPKSALWI